MSLPSFTSMNIDEATRTAPIACCTPLDELEMSDEEAEQTAVVFKALADPARIRLVNLLATADEPVCVCQLTPSLRLSQPTVSHHLKKLVQAGLLRREQRGVWAYYSLDRQGLADAASALELEGAVPR